MMINFHSVFKKAVPAERYRRRLHLPTHDLFWAKVRVQLHLPPLRSLDLLISPGALLGTGHGSYIYS